MTEIEIEEKIENVQVDNESDSLYEEAKIEAEKFKQDKKLDNGYEEANNAYHFLKKVVPDEDTLSDIGELLTTLSPAKEKIVIDAFNKGKNKKALAKKLVDLVDDPKAAAEFKSGKTAAFREKINIMSGSLHKSQRPSSIIKEYYNGDSGTNSQKQAINDLNNIFKNNR